MNKKILLTIAPLFWPNMPPLNLAVLKSFLKKNNTHADTLDLNNYFFNLFDEELKKEWKKSCNIKLEDSIFNKIKNKFLGQFDSIIKKICTYEIVGFSCYKSNLETTLKFIKELREVNKKIKIVLGGPEITSLYLKYGKNFIDCFKDIDPILVVGEGELALLDILKGSNKKIFIFNELKTLENLDSPDFSTFDLKNYPIKKSIPILFSKGCINKCRFCAEKLMFRKYRNYSFKNIIKEIKYHKDKGIEKFVFYDSLINGNLRKLEYLCDNIINEFGSINWEAQFAIRSIMSDRLLKKMKQSGCLHLFIGMETGSDDVLKRMNKSYTANEALNFFRRLNKEGLSFGLSMIVGFPGETKEEFLESVNFIIDNKKIIKKIEQINPFVNYNGIDVFNNDSDYIKEIFKRTKYFIRKIQKAKIRHKRAFMLNLIDN